MKTRLIIFGILLTACTVISAQSMVGMTKEEVKVVVKKKHKEFRKDNTVVKQRFNYIKYVNGLRTRTWILYFTDDDICKTSKLVCDYSEYDDIMEDLHGVYQKVGDDSWEYSVGTDTFSVNLIKGEWYFSVRETRKQNP